MIVARSPLRISLGGGGTDLPSYYQQREGFLISAAIDKYVYITLHETFDKGYYLKYSKFEHVQEIDEIQHPIIREALKCSTGGRIILRSVPWPIFRQVRDSDLRAASQQHC